MPPCAQFWPSSHQCGRGTCSQEGLCVCHPGWQSIGDLTLEPFQSCDIKSSVFSLLWTIALVFFALSLSASLLVIRARYSSSSKIEWTRLNVAMHITPVFSVFGTSLALYRVIKPHAYFGADVAATVLFFFTQISLYAVSTLIMSSVHVLLLRQAKTKELRLRMRRRKMSKLIDASFAFGLLVLFFAAISPVAMLVNQSKTWRFFHFFFSFVGIFAMASGGLAIILGVLSDIDEVLKQDLNGANTKQLARLRRRFYFVLMLTANVAYGVAANSALYAFVPWLVRKGSYTVPINWTLGSVFIVAMSILFLSSKGSGSETTPSSRAVVSLKSPKASTTTFTGNSISSP